MKGADILERRQVVEIGRELVRISGAGDPAHPKLAADIQRAAWVALHSPAFRNAIAMLAADGHGVRRDDPPAIRSSQRPGRGTTPKKP